MPGELIPWLRHQLFDDDGAPLSLGSISSFLAGTSTPAATFSDATLATANPVVIDLDAAGLPPDPIYLGNFGYKFEIADADGAVIQTIDSVENVGQVFAATYGTQLVSESALDEASGYIVPDDDTITLVTMDSTGGADPCVVTLCAASARAKPLVIKNMGTVALAVTPNGSDTIDGLAAAYTVAASASPLFRTITLNSDGVDAWWITAAVGV